jgi:hypothetical protein
MTRIERPVNSFGHSHRRTATVPGSERMKVNAGRCPDVQRQSRSEPAQPASAKRRIRGTRELDLGGSSTGTPKPATWGLAGPLHSASAPSSVGASAGHSETRGEISP